MTKRRDVEIIGNDAAADRVGLSPVTWRVYVSRGYAPAPHRREIQGGYARPVWWRSALDEWRANRPGQGARTDLTRA